MSTKRPPSKAKLLKLAHDGFGYETFRPGQEAAIRAVLAGSDTLAVMPTGSGKSAIYEIAGGMLPGPTVIVSPLIALQRDQVEAITAHELGTAALINSTQRAATRRETLDSLAIGDLQFIFLAPEQFANADVRERVIAAQPSLFVVDEAHCVSEWGHDFRPDYLRLGEVIDALGHPVVLALTATAAPPVRAEIVQRLGMRDAKVIVEGFDRPNIWLGVERYERESDKRAALIARVAEAEKPGVVYAATHAISEELAAALRGEGISAGTYHAGMRAADRERVQEAFMRDELAVIVATTAFGMGIDKPNVRFVFHYDVSESVDSYYQEIGRAGRDGQPARAILFYRPEDLGLRRFFAGSGQVDLDQVAQVAYAIERHEGPVDPVDLRSETGLSQSRLTAAINRLEETGALETLSTGEIVEEHPITAHEVAQAAEKQENHQRFVQSRVEMMRGYAETDTCRRIFVLTYFGEQTHGRCGHCDRCDAGAPTPDASITTGDPFVQGGRVRHAQWGEGTVMRYEQDKIVVLFDAVGYKSLATALSLSAVCSLPYNRIRERNAEQCG